MRIPEWTVKPDIRVEGDLAFIPLTRGYVSVMDAADVHLAMGHSWHAKVKKNTVYAMSNLGKNKGFVQLHRLIMGLKKHEICDHIDLDGLNNRRSNLRLATQSENLCNRRASSNNKSKIKGVYWMENRRRWRVRIVKHGRRFHIGTYKSLEEACSAYAQANTLLHGEFGRLR